MGALSRARRRLYSGLPVHTSRPQRRGNFSRALPYLRRLQLEALEHRCLLSASLGNLVWNDLNSNGLQDAGEPGIAGVAVEVFSSAGNVSRGLTVTDASGNYALGGLSEGVNYYLVFRAPVGATATPYVFTTKDANSNTQDTLDSDANASGVTDVFTLTAGQNRTDLDAGLVGAAPAIGWTIRTGSSAQSVAVDADGNEYVAGTFQGQTDFDPGPGIYNLTSASAVGFVAKYSLGGALLWARQAAVTPRDIAVAADGSVCTTGYFTGSADFDPGSGTFNLTSAGSNDIFVWKLDSAGNFAWAVRAGGTYSDSGRAIALAGDGSVCVTGSFQDTPDFDPGPGTLTLAGDYYGNAFVWKLTSTRAERRAGSDVHGVRPVGADGAYTRNGSCVCPTSAHTTIGRS